MEPDIFTIAFDATTGTGNDSEIVDFRVLKTRLGRVPTEDEMKTFDKLWRQNLQDMAQP